MKKTILLGTIVISLFSFVLGYAEDGVTSKEILLGSTNAQGGPSSFLGIRTNHGMNSYFNYINEKGGVNGRKIKVITYDDGYEPIPCALNTKKLIEEDKVFMLTCYVGTPTGVKAQPVWTNAKVPLLGFFTGAEALRTPFNHYNIHVRASYYQEAAKAVDYFVNTLGLKKVAIFYQYDAFGEAVKKGAEIALDKYNLKPVAYGSFERNTINIEDGLNNIKDSNPEAIVMVGTYAPLAKFVREAQALGLNKTYFHTVSFVGPEAYAQELNGQYDRVLVTQVMPLYTCVDLPVVKQYLELLKKYYPEDKPNFVSLEGFTNALVLVEGLKRCGEKLTREGFITAIESIKDWDPGLGAKITYNSTDHQGLENVNLTRIDSDGKYKLIE